MADLEKKFRLFSLDEPGQTNAPNQINAPNQSNDLGRTALEEAIRAYSKPILAFIAGNGGEARVEDLLKGLRQQNMQIEPSQLVEIANRLQSLGLVQIVKDQAFNFLIKS